MPIRIDEKGEENVNEILEQLELFVHIADSTVPLSNNIGKLLGSNCKVEHILY